MADVNELANWSGPHKTRADAIEAMRLLCGTGYDAMIWLRGGADGKKGRWYINDGIDPDTGKRWKTEPKNGIVSWARM